MASYRVLIVGSGATGSAAARALSQLRPLPPDVVVVDKGSRPGGRFTTAVSPTLADSQADTGAQYITRRSDAHTAMFDDLRRAGVIQPLSGAILGDTRGAAENYAAPRGMASVPRFFLEQAAAASPRTTALQGVRVSGIKRAQDQRQWVVDFDDGERSSDAALSSPFDAIISTLPVPQMLQLRCDASVIPEALRAMLQRVKYSSRYALTCYWRYEDSPAVSAALPFTARYVSTAEDDDVVRYICVDSAKRGAGPAAPPSVVLHSSIAFGSANLDRDARVDIAPVLLQHLHRLCPGLPPPADVRCHRWRYSQVLTPFEGDGGGAVSAGEAAAGAPLLVLAGDAFSASHLEGCWTSAAAAVEMVRRDMAERRSDAPVR